MLVLIYDGEIQVSITGGVEPYYEWENTNGITYLHPINNLF